MTYYNTGKVRKLGDNKILGLGQIIRYNNRPKLKDENVAEHSFYVISTVLKIVKMFNLSDEVKYKALEFATVHDIPEMYTGDMPYDTKVANPELARLLQIAELDQLEKNMPEFLDAYKQFVKEEEEGTIAYLVTKLADTVSVLQYSNLEIELGNKTKSMHEINIDSQERVAKLIDKLEAKIKDENTKKISRYNGSSEINDWMMKL